MGNQGIILLFFKNIDRVVFGFDFGSSGKMGTSLIKGGNGPGLVFVCLFGPWA